MDPSPALLSTLQKLPLFQELSPTQLKNLFRICKQETYEEGARLCEVGTHSDEMFIVLSGSVDIRGSEDGSLAVEKAVTSVGETGLLTGEVRAASVMTVEPVTALVIKRRPLQQLMQQDLPLAIRLYRNAMLIMRQKLIAADVRVEEMLKSHV